MMDRLGRLLRVVTALIIAVIIGSLALLLLSPLAGDAIVGGLERFRDALLQAGDRAALIRETMEAMGRFLMLIAVAPVVFTGLLGEIARWRSLLWYGVGTALLTAAIPWIMRGAWLTPTSGEARVSAYLGIAGLVSGTIYWLIAGSRSSSNANDEGAKS